MPTQYPDIFNALRSFFYADELEWKIQAYNNRDQKAATKAMVVPYLSARAIQNRLDETVGAENWTVDYVPGPQGGVMCVMALRINGEWIRKSDGADNSKVEAIKGGYSDSMKRAAVTWGIGRYLYEFPKSWYPLKDGRPEYGNGRSDPAVPKAFLPADADANGLRSAKKAPAPAQKSAPAAKAPEPVVEEKAEAPAPAPAPAPAYVPGSKKYYPNDATKRVLWAKVQVIKPEFGTPLAGSTLGVAMEDAAMGPAILKFLSGKGKNSKGVQFTPKNEAEDIIHQAATILLEAAEEATKKA